MLPRNRLILVVGLWLAEGCGSVRPGLQPPVDSGEEALETATGSGGVRLLSDVPIPTEPDASRGASGGALRDAGVRTLSGDALEEVGAIIDAEADDACNDGCANAKCGDGILQAGEECDEGS